MADTDGPDWVRVTEHAAWAPRDSCGEAVHAGRMWLLGGWYIGRLPEGGPSDAVWSSADGSRWDLAAEHAGWSPRLGAGAVSFRGRLRVLGGGERYFDAEPRHLRNDVWCSADGARWEELRTPTVWSPRHEHSAYVHEGGLWIAGGNAWPLVNDVWRLRLPEDWQAARS